MGKLFAKDKYQKSVFMIYAGILIFGGLYFLWIQTTGLAIPCTIHKITGYYCPGCGMTRAVFLLLHGQIRDALRENAAVLSLALFWIIYSIGILYPKFTFLRNPKIIYILLYSSALILILFGIIRNFPAFEFLRPFTTNINY